MKTIKNKFLSFIFYFAYSYIKSIKNTKKRLEFKTKIGILNKDLEPVRCEKCGSKSLIDVVKNIDSNVVSEVEKKCNNCNHTTGYKYHNNWFE